MALFVGRAIFVFQRHSSSCATLGVSRCSLLGSRHFLFQRHSASCSTLIDLPRIATPSLQLSNCYLHAFCGYDIATAKDWRRTLSFIIIRMLFGLFLRGSRKISPCLCSRACWLHRKHIILESPTVHLPNPTKQIAHPFCDESQG